MSVLGPSLALLALLTEAPAQPEDDVAAHSETVVQEPSAEAPPQSAPQPAPAGGFGSVEDVTTTSNVVAPPPPPPDPNQDPDAKPEPELSARVELGYGQTNLGNAEGLDHHGLYLRAHLVFFPWISKGRRIAGGLGGTYSYQGLNRNELPSTVELDKSSGQQQAVLLNVDMLLRPHLEWVSIHTAAMIGLGFYTNASVFAADRPARISGREYAFVVGGSLALCTAWDMVCVTGGSQLLLEVMTLPRDPVRYAPESIDPWGWHVGLGFDVMRMFARANRVPT